MAGWQMRLTRTGIEAAANRRFLLFAALIIGMTGFKRLTGTKITFHDKLLEPA